ncbi:MAG: phosphatidylserine/phosphatidylglycerophosphate/cardiolipin synthase-like enzyme [Myxococcota bacterium]|jgi:phosphatidylserine/phosphatidylglycerophosphate/cardiolipin synthase-like enzyme
MGAIEAGSAEAAAVLALVNDAATTQLILDDDAALDRRAATNLIAHRNGADAVFGTADDDLFDDIAEVDAVKYVGKTALGRLLIYATEQGYLETADVPVVPVVEDVDAAIVAFVNGPSINLELLDITVGLDKRAAKNILAFRVGADGEMGTEDDPLFADIAAVDAIKYVGKSALKALAAYVVANPPVIGEPSAQDTESYSIFSPQTYYNSHLAEVVARIDAALYSVDVAIYSFSDAGVYAALDSAVQRGLPVRVLFETARTDKNKTGDALAASRSAKLEKMGVDVRYVNKIMHHKFAIIDGPRDVIVRAETATIISGSANFSHGGATKYDENTLFLAGYPELALRFQAEFDHLWNHSRDFTFETTLPWTLSTSVIDEAVLAQYDAADIQLHVTSDNFKANNQTFSITSGLNTVSDALVAAIEGAEQSIWVASGHLRSRPVAEALLAKQLANPDMDIRVYLDGQEYISAWYHNKQIDKFDDCLVAAGDSASKIGKCTDTGFYFGYALGETGIDVRYKYYAYRWHYAYSPQMHNKFLIIDQDTLWTGSYNLSDNAEHNTFENMAVLSGERFANVIAAYSARFETLWNTRRDGTLGELIDTVNTADSIPLVFDAMALDHAQVTQLKQAIRTNCPDVFSDEYRDEPTEHLECPRDEQ